MCIGVAAVVWHTGVGLSGFVVYAPSAPQGPAVSQQEVTAAAPVSTTTPPATRVLFVGDVMLARAVETLMNKEGSAYPYTYTAPLHHAHDYVVANFEASVPAVHVPTPPYVLRFSVAESHLPALRESGVTHLSLANNHSDDFGVDGYHDTERALTQAGFTVFGAAHTVNDTYSITTVASGSVPFRIFGLSTLSPAFDTSEAAALLETYDDLPAVVFIHWGREYELRHSDRQEEIARALADAGAALIIGHHPHVVQDVARYGDTLVFYSLGNYIFDQYFQPEVEQGLAVSLSLTARDSWSVTLVPVSYAAHKSAPEPLRGAPKEAFLTALAARSQPDLREMIRGGELVHPLAAGD